MALKLTRRLLSVSTLFSHAPRRVSFFCTTIDSETAIKIPKIESPLGIVSFHGDWDLTKQAIENPGMDYKHWEITLYKKIRDESKQHVIDCSIQAPAQVLGSEEEAKKRIYKVVFKPGHWMRFGCQVDLKTALVIAKTPGVAYIFADRYADRKNKDYGGELLVNGEIVERSRKV